MKKNKSDILDYIDWRGDLSFEAAPFGDVDSLILCQLSYLNFSGLVSKSFEESTSLFEVSKLFFASSDFERRSKLGFFIDPATLELLKKASESKRFGNIGVCGFVSEHDEQKEEQFSAVTFILDESSMLGRGLVYLAFRGTDDTLIGWKEDFNLAFMSEVPAQKDAVSYLERAALNFRKSDIISGGHSKGGNLAIYSAAHVNEKIKRRIQKVYNFDGPGFSQAVLDSDDFFSIKTKITSFYPQFSIVGMLFHHYDFYKSVLSDEKLLMQHNPFSWFVKGKTFETKEELDSGSGIFFRSFNVWFEKLSSYQREQFVETLFSLLEATNAQTNSELLGNVLKNAPKILKAFAKLDSEIRDDATHIAADFIKIIAKESVNH